MTEFYDVDGDGALDRIEYVQYDDGSTAALIDLNEDGLVDVGYYDTNGDGQVDYVAQDVNGDGVADQGAPVGAGTTDVTTPGVGEGMAAEQGTGGDGTDSSGGSVISMGDGDAVLVDEGGVYVSTDGNSWDT